MEWYYLPEVFFTLKFPFSRNFIFYKQNIGRSTNISIKPFFAGQKLCHQHSLYQRQLGTIMALEKLFKSYFYHHFQTKISEYFDK